MGSGLPLKVQQALEIIQKDNADLVRDMLVDLNMDGEIFAADYAVALERNPKKDTLTAVDIATCMQMCWDAKLERDAKWAEGIEN